MPRNGFTIIELLIAISIVAIIATIGLVTYFTAQKTARISKRVQDLQAIQTALELYRTANGGYPTNASSNVLFGACITPAASPYPLAALVPTYMPSLPKDPLSPNCYYYRSDGYDYKIRTGGSLNNQDNSDMVSADFAQQPTLLDPKRDGGSVDCTVETSGTPIYSAWALFTNSACGW